MSLVAADLLILHEEQRVSLTELVELSRLDERDVQRLIDGGVLRSCGEVEHVAVFDARCVVIARAARRLRDDFELDHEALQLALTLLERVRDLEAQLSELKARMPSGGRANP